MYILFNLRLANEIWNDLYDSDDVDKKRIVRESIDERSPRKCSFD